MCVFCDGDSIAEWYERTSERVGEGWSLTHVDGDVPWTYTTGLIEHHGHPELVVVGPGPERAAQLLDALAWAVDDGARFSAGEVWVDDGESVTFGEVHPRQFEFGLMAAWELYYELEGWAPGPPQALQVRPPDTWFCPSHRADLAECDLSQQVDVLHPRLNRAQRRALERRRR